jgi:hypothetical protein
MRLISCAALVLIALLVAATVDEVPDPPAVTQHTVNVKASCLRDVVSDIREQGLSCDLHCISLQIPIHRVRLVDAPKPTRSNDWILAGCATDTSPPLL